MHCRKSACSASFVAVVLACATLGPTAAFAAQPAVPGADAGAPGQVHFGTWGVDLSARDLAVSPGDAVEEGAVVRVAAGSK